MFSVVKAHEEIILQSATGKVTILPNCGAILNAWQVQLHGKDWAIIDGYESASDFAQNCEGNGFKSVKLSPYVCRMNHSKYTFDAVHYTIGKYELAGNAIHGLLYNEPFDVMKTNADETGASVALQHVYEGTDAGYPFTYNIQIEYILQENNSLTLRTTVHNTCAAGMPIADGWHPYFSLGKKIDELKVVMNANTMLEFDERLIPTGKHVDYTLFQQPEILGTTELDNCFELNKQGYQPACKIMNEEANIEVSIFAKQNYPYIQVYTPPHRSSIAVENLSAAPDAFNNGIGLKDLEPGDTIVFEATYQVSAIK